MLGRCIVMKFIASVVQIFCGNIFERGIFFGEHFQCTVKFANTLTSIPMETMLFIEPAGAGVFLDVPVVTDGRYTTANGMPSALAFANELVSLLAED